MDLEKGVQAFSLTLPPRDMEWPPDHLQKHLIYSPLQRTLPLSFWLKLILSLPVCIVSFTIYFFLHSKHPLKKTSSTPTHTHNNHRKHILSAFSRPKPPSPIMKKIHRKDKRILTNLHRVRMKTVFEYYPLPFAAMYVYCNVNHNSQMYHS